MKNIFAAVILGIALASVSFAQVSEPSGPMKESMETMKKAWKDSTIQLLIDAIAVVF